mmetsp:Transcript_43982/g.108885  ORF Transcript_43982/g.108885 Transcript_43982/m.108885 type:complete len:233 (+) Transcript_43982:258-956(+)
MKSARTRRLGSGRRGIRVQRSAHSRHPQPALTCGRVSPVAPTCNRRGLGGRAGAHSHARRQCPHSSPTPACRCRAPQRASQRAGEALRTAGAAGREMRRGCTPRRAWPPATQVRRRPCARLRRSAQARARAVARPPSAACRTRVDRRARARSRRTRGQRGRWLRASGSSSLPSARPQRSQLGAPRVPFAELARGGVRRPRRPPRGGARPSAAPCTPPRERSSRRARPRTAWR